jgi:hypothetical protein
MPRHHTVPEVYLKAFYDPAKVAEKQNVLWLYEENRKIRLRGADAVAAVEDFSSDPEWVGNEDLAEKASARLEEAAVPVLEKLRAGDPRLTEDEKGRLSYFIGFQKFRTTLNREILDAAAVDEFRYTCRRLLDENPVHEIVGTTEEEISGRVRSTLEDVEKFVRAERSEGVEETRRGPRRQAASEDVDRRCEIL